VLRRLREQHEMTLAALSEASGVSVPVISKLERNQQSAELDTLYRLGRAFGMSHRPARAGGIPPRHRGAEDHAPFRPVKFRQIRFANVVALLGTAPASSKVSRPEIHHDDTEVCWVLEGKSCASRCPTRNVCSRPASACSSTPSNSTPTSRSPTAAS